MDDVESIGEGTPPYLVTSTGVGRGELQQIEDLRTSLLGPDGLLAEIKKLELPDEEDLYG